MSSESVSILLIEDDLAQARFLQEMLKNSDLTAGNFVHVKRLQSAINQLQQDRFDVILLDLSLPDSQGLSSVETIVNHAPFMPIVVLTNTNDQQLAIAAVRQGAQDYLVKKQINQELLVRSLRYAIERQRAADLLREANQNLLTQVEKTSAELNKVQEINQLKSDLVSMFSHDFRNPLTTVLSCAELLQNRGHLLTEEKKISLFKMMRQAGKNMAQLLDEVLLVGRADSGTLQLNLSSLNLETFCENLLGELEFTANKKKIEVILNAEGEFNNCLWDENLLRHILGNIIANSIKYSQAGQSVLLELIGQPEAVVFRLQDWGMGIPPEDLEYLFEPFRRASNVGNIPGTGLGLAIAKSCTQTHGGKIEVVSKLGVGTTVTVTIPKIPASTKQKAG